MWCFSEEFRILWNWGSPVLQEEGSPSRANDSSASRVYESQSAFHRLVKVRWGGSGRFTWKTDIKVVHIIPIRNICNGRNIGRTNRYMSLSKKIKLNVVEPGQLHGTTLAVETRLPCLRGNVTSPEATLHHIR